MTHPLLTRLGDADPAVRRDACAALPDDPSAILLLEPLAEALADADPEVRRAAGDALVCLGRTSSQVDPLLLAALRGDAPESRFEAARALAALSPPAPRLIPALVEALGNPRPEIAWEAARLLVDAGRLHGEVAPIVTGLVRAGETSALRRMAIFCLRELAPERPETEDALLFASRADDPALRRAALSALPALLRSGASAEAVHHRLEEAARGDPDSAVRVLAERARNLAGEQAR
jgi:HEAT repeat protein